MERYKVTVPLVEIEIYTDPTDAWNEAIHAVAEYIEISPDPAESTDF